MVWVGKDVKDPLVPTPLPWAGILSTQGCVGVSSSYVCVCNVYFGVNTPNSLYLHVPKYSRSEHSVLFMVYVCSYRNMNTYSTRIHKTPLNLSNPGDTQHSLEQGNTYM